MRRLGQDQEEKSRQQPGDESVAGSDCSFWSGLYEYELTEEEAREASLNLLGFFNALAALTLEVEDNDEDDS